jgi:hypothetical protein
VSSRLSQKFAASAAVAIVIEAISQEMFHMPPLRIWLTATPAATVPAAVEIVRAARRSPLMRPPEPSPLDRSAEPS